MIEEDLRRVSQFQERQEIADQTLEAVLAVVVGMQSRQTDLAGCSGWTVVLLSHPSLAHLDQIHQFSWASLAQDVDWACHEQDWPCHTPATLSVEH